MIQPTTEQIQASAEALKAASAALYAAKRAYHYSRTAEKRATLDAAYRAESEARAAYLETLAAHHNGRVL